MAIELFSCTASAQMITLFFTLFNKARVNGRFTIRSHFASALFSFFLFEKQLSVTVKYFAKMQFSCNV